MCSNNTDTERLYTLATQELVSKYNDKEYSWDIKVKCMGMKGDVAAKIIIDSLSLPLTVNEYLAKVDELYLKYFPMAQMLPGTIQYS